MLETLFLALMLFLSTLVVLISQNVIIEGIGIIIIYVVAILISNARKGQ